ncbi:PAS domain S-box protein [Microvirga makkahensis]|uniref:Blue-light-activated histidine kinase n=1 Tax=Microvirga makkahensis TaxID=1128670 RepID=A0A7X3MS81_9HYPH|nr:PAS domain S-box protein [Microvirga makkahensis]MXQ12254.1 PAS domain S-box protein [Microvirga makkahensis]
MPRNPPTEQKRAGNTPFGATREQSFEILESVADAFFAIDRHWCFTYVNRAAAERWGRNRENLIGKHFLEEFPAAVGSEPYEAFLTAMQERQAARLEVVSPVLHQWVELSISPTRDGGLSVYFRDISARKRVEEVEGWLAAIIESSDDAIVSKNLESIVTSWNAGAERLFGYRAEEIIGRPITILFPEDRQDEEERILARIRRGERVEHFESTRQRKDGSLIEVSLTISPIKDTQGRIVGASKIARDITRHKEAERLQRLLVHELNHRVKNILATVQAIAQQTLSSRQSDDAVRETFEARLLALSKAHDLLTRENWDGASLSQVVAEALSPYQRDRFETGGPDVRLTPKMALALALALHELATNAAKYGALSVPAGRIAIMWRVQPNDPPHLILRWQERGGPPVSSPERKGFGSRLIERSLALELAGDVKITYDPAGVVCELKAPLVDERDDHVGKAA